MRPFYFQIDLYNGNEKFKYNINLNFAQIVAGQLPDCSRRIDRTNKSKFKFSIVLLK